MKSTRFWVIVFALCIFGNLRGVNWSEPEMVGSGGYPLLAVDNQSILWCYVWPWMYSYRNEASGWQPEIEMGVGYWGRPCFDKGNTLWLLTESSDYAKLIYAKYYDGDWTGIDTVPTNVYWKEGAKITADSSGGIWVGWTTEWGYYYWDVGYNRYKDGTWGEPLPVTDTLGVVDNELWSMTTDSEGRVWFGWTNANDPETPGSSQIKAAYNEDDAWSEELTVCSQEGVLPWFIDLTPDRVGGMWALWNYKTGYSEPRFVLVSYWDGGAWSEPDTVADAGLLGGYSPYPQGKLAVDTYGNVWAVWRQAEEDKDKYGDIYYSVNSGSGWSEPEPVDDDPGADGSPDIAVDGKGRIWCAWVSTRDDSAGVWASYTTSAGVGEAVVPIISPIRISTTLNRLSYDIPGEARLILYSADGRRILEETIEGKGTWVASSANLSQGVYFARVVTKGAASNQKLIVLK